MVRRRPGRFFRKTRSKRGAGRCEARDTRRTKLQPARPIQRKRPGYEAWVVHRKSMRRDAAPWDWEIF